jgi:hypothetical protein
MGYGCGSYLCILIMIRRIGELSALVSDWAKALIQLTEKGLECLNMPDFFHVMHDLMALTFRRVREAGLLPPPALRTGRESFPSSGSSISKAV